MSQPGASDPLASARRVLLDALAGLVAHREAVILVGAQALYLQTVGAPVGIPASTKDSDLAIDRRVLADEPLLEQAMRDAGFEIGAQPGAWLGAGAIPVDLMIPESMSDPGGRRGARVPPHSRLALRRAAGLEAAVIDGRAHCCFLRLLRHCLTWQVFDPSGRFSIQVEGFTAGSVVPSLPWTSPAPMLQWLLR